MERTATGAGSLSYWLIVVLLLVLGFLSAFSIGPIFWFIAATMIVLSPFRSRPHVFRSALALFGGFLVGYLLVVPFGCTQSASFDPGTGIGVTTPVICRSLTGIEYSGPDPYDPSSIPALIVGGVTAIVAAGTTWYSTGRRERGSTGSLP